MTKSSTSSSSSSAHDITEDPSDGFIIHGVIPQTSNNDNRNDSKNVEPKTNTSSLNDVLGLSAYDQDSSSSESEDAGPATHAEKPKEQEQNVSKKQVVTLSRRVQPQNFKADQDKADVVNSSDKQLKRVRFSEGSEQDSPPRKKEKLATVAKSANKMDTDMEEEFQLFKAELKGIGDASEEADIDLAENEDAREEQKQKELRERVQRLRDSLRNIGKRKKANSLSFQGAS